MCHDLGHGPFSHAFESFTKLAGIEFEHEDMSAKLIGRILNNNEALTNEVEAEDEAKIALQDCDETAQKLARWDDCANLEDPPFLSVSDFLLVRTGSPLYTSSFVRSFVIYIYIIRNNVILFFVCSYVRFVA